MRHPFEDDQWASFPPRIALHHHDIHVVRIALEHPFDGATDLLDEREQQRAARFVFARDRRRFLVAHAWMRIVLGQCLDRDPRSLQFAVGPNGKPYLVDPPLDLRFNLSHAGEIALLAVALGRDVGVDVEKERPIEIVTLARHFFARAECEALEALDASERSAAFFQCWTRKEAFIKVLGDGLAFPLDGFAVSLASEESAQLLCSCVTVPDALARWCIRALRIRPGYAAAVAAAGGDWRIVRWQVPRLTDAT